jgi:hypothetical protein
MDTNRERNINGQEQGYKRTGRGKKLTGIQTGTGTQTDRDRDTDGSERERNFFGLKTLTAHSKLKGE